MILGIKVGLQKTSLQDLATVKPPFCEVWFDINRSDQYRDLFDYTVKQHIATGLHYWGALNDGTWTNLAYPDHALISKTLELMRKTIDIAAKHHFVYVNIHPGTQGLTKIDFKQETFSLISEPVSYDISENLFLENIMQLNEYAIKAGVLLTVETVPSRVTNGWYDPQARSETVLNIYELPAKAILKAAKAGVAAANDFGHLAAGISSLNRTEVAGYLFENTRLLMPYTRLIHAGYIRDPFNGTDFHDTFLNPIFNSDLAVPNNYELRKLLALFLKHPDVYILAEPASDHVGNYLFLKKILENMV